jgi:hypothetical protein
MCSLGPELDTYKAIWKLIMPLVVGSNVRFALADCAN